MLQACLLLLPSKLLCCHHWQDSPCSDTCICVLLQLGDASKSIIALEDLEVSMRGAPEVHAALAAVLYAERPAQRLRAEQQWDIALEFDSRYQDADWVAKNKHWPPTLMDALQKFLLLQ